MLEINLAITGLFFSILFSSSEIALISANKLQIDVWIKQKYKFANLTRFIIKNKSKFLIVALIGTNLANILASSFATVYLIQIMSKYNFFNENIVFLPIALIILVFGEILPKTIIREYSNIMLLVFSPILYFFYVIFYPIVYLFNKINVVNNNVVISKKDLIEEKRNEFEGIFHKGDQSINIDKEQHSIISKIFDYRDQIVKNVMTPTDEISCISFSAELDDLAHKFIDSGHSKLLVFDKNLNDVKGIIYIYDLYSKPISLKDIIRKVIFISEDKLIEDLMKIFKKNNQSTAIAINSKGDTTGLITIEDIYEEIFGEFDDEFDYKNIQSFINKDGSITTNAKISIEDFNKKYNDIIPNGDYETIGGYIIKEIDRIPNENEHIFLNIGHIIIKKATARRIEQIQIFINQSD
ncbi:MAG: hypothetical protein CMG49_01480 [Candidatus Marinimicrobia bacterium]|nr:hypothetical protein [Candidatus Neomarinimicrobiota bacterium]